MAGAKKREAVCRLVRNLKAKGLRIDGVGMQSHNGLDYPNLEEYEKSIDAFAACGVKVMITELDVIVLPNPQGFGGAAVEQSFEFQQRYNPYTDGLPATKQKELDQRWLALFKIYYKHRSQISRINLWGISDGGSWLNGWPMAGRTNYPLLFDRQYLHIPIIEDAAAGITHEQGTDSQPHPDMAFLYRKAAEECGASFRRVLLAIMEHDYSQGAVLWHCAGGKDRTGIVAALILEALGADRGDIMADYLETNAAIREYFHLSPGEDLAGRVDPAWLADERYLQAAWDAMGGNYLRDVLWIDECTVSAFRKKVLG